MEILWQTKAPLTVREVSNGLSQRNLAHTTVMTVLDRLAKKGFARRERDGRAWRYRPAETREAYVAELMLTALEQTGDRDAALARFARSVSGSEAIVLRKALAEFDASRNAMVRPQTEGDTGIQLWGAWLTRRCSPWSPSEACEEQAHCCVPDGHGVLRRPRFCYGRHSDWPAGSQRSALCWRSASAAPMWRAMGLSAD
jgi:predicted transcriptional regulator